MGGISRPCEQRSLPGIQMPGCFLGLAIAVRVAAPVYSLGGLSLWWSALVL